MNLVSFILFCEAVCVLVVVSGAGLLWVRRELAERSRPIDAIDQMSLHELDRRIRSGEITFDEVVERMRKKF